jgi:hypothetical protein
MSFAIGSAQSLGIESSKIREFYRQNWARQIALSDKSFYDWQFLSAPNQLLQDLCHLAVDENNGEIAGVMGLNERPFNMMSKTVIGAELTTWIVGEKYQGMGVGSKMLSNLQSIFEVMIGMNISDAALPLYLKSGFRFTRTIPRYFRIYNSTRVGEISELSPLVDKIMDHWTKQERYLFSESLPNHGDLMYVDSVMRSFSNHFSRSSAFLQWRYTNHPYFKYEQRLVINPSDPQKKLLVVFRVEETDSGFRVLHVMDLLGDLENIPSAISFINSYASLNKIDLADFYCTFPKVLDYFYSHGWFSSTDDTFLKVPNLFQPLELRSPQTSSMILWGKGLGKDAFNISNLYVTKEDCDLDRPTMFFIEHKF